MAVLVALMSLAVPASSFASAQDVIKDCAKDSKLDKTYSQADLAAARKQLPADVDEYTDCRDVIRRAQLGGGGSGGSPGGTGTGAPAGGGSATAPRTSAADALAVATPQERAAVRDAVKGGKAPVKLGDHTVSPSSLGVGDLAKTHRLPGPLILVLILLGVAGAGGGLALVRRSR